jgi:excisionase family DNA binding protein
MSARADNSGIRMQEAARLVLTVPGAAGFLCVSESIIRRLIKENRIPYFQIEGRYLFYVPALERWIEENIVEANGRPTKEIANERATEIIEQINGG